MQDFIKAGSTMIRKDSIRSVQFLDIKYPYCPREVYNRQRDALKLERDGYGIASILGMFTRIKSIAKDGTFSMQNVKIMQLKVLDGFKTGTIWLHSDTQFLNSLEQITETSDFVNQQNVLTGFRPTEYERACVEFSKRVPEIYYVAQEIESIAIK